MIRYLAVLKLDGPAFAGTPVPEKIIADKGGMSLATVDVTAAHTRALSMVILKNRLDELRSLGRKPFLEIKGSDPLHVTPAVISSLGNDVDLLLLVLPNICAVKGFGFEIPMQPPWVSHACSPYLGPKAWLINEGVVLGDAVLQEPRPLIDVDAENFAQEGKGILGKVVRIVGLASIPR